MKLTMASVYALHAIAYIAQHGHDGPIPSHVVAEACALPERFLLKLLKALGDCDPPVLDSVPGRGGGFHLARGQSEVSLLEIVEAPVPPAAGENFNRKLHAQVERICNETADLVREHLRKIRLSDFAGKQR